MTDGTARMVVNESCNGFRCLFAARMPIGPVL